MKNKKSLLLGFILTAVVILFFNGIFQYLILFILSVDVEKFQFQLGSFYPIFHLNGNNNIYFSTILIMLPIWVNIIYIETSFYLLKKLPPGFGRYSIIVSVIIMVGYIIIFTFYGMIEVIIVQTNESIWDRIINLWKLSGNQIYVLVFFILLVLFTYLQLVQKRIMKYIVISKTD